MSITHNLTHSEIEIVNIQWILDFRIQSDELKKFGWKFERINTMGISFYKSAELNGSGYVKIPLRSSALVNIKNNDKYCALWSILTSLHPCNINPDRVSKYKQYFNELNIQGFDFSNEFECCDMHKFGKLNNLPINIFEVNYYQEQYNWKQKLIPIEIGKNKSDRVVDLLIYKNHYVLIN